MQVVFALLTDNSYYLYIANIVQITHVYYAVDRDYLGKTNAAVAFIAACLTTAVNKDYIKRQLLATLKGQPPSNYTKGNNNTLDETKLKGYKGLNRLSTKARKALGFKLIQSH